MKNIVNEFFDGVTPVRSDDEIISDVLRKAENMKKESKRFNIRKPVAAACAAVCILGVGATAVAATGLVDFNAIFGKYISDNSVEHGSGLLATISSDTPETGDEIYAVRLNGVTGTDHSVIGSFELYRRDGLPVSDYFINEPASDVLHSEWYTTVLDDTGIPQKLENGGTSMHFMDITINEDGNIDCFFTIDSTNKTSEKDILVSLKSLYAKDSNDNPIPMLALDLLFRFDYTPSEVATVTKEINSAAPFVLNYASNKGDNVYEHITPINSSEITAINTTIYFDNFNCFDAWGESWLEYVDNEECNEFNMIMNDGSIVPMKVYHDNGIGGTTPDMLYTLAYLDENGNRIALDISQAEALSINGTIYPLA